MAIELSVIVPVYNEAGSLGALVEGLRAAASRLPSHEVLIVDDGSTDGTSAAVPSAAPFRVLRHPVNRGNGAAVKTGLAAASGQVVAVMDADGQHRVEDLIRLVAELRSGWDLAVGARRDLGRQRRGWGNVALSALASYLSGRSVPDLTSGLRALRRDRALEFVHLYPDGFSFPSTSTLAFLVNGYPVKFVDIEPIPRVRGESKIRALRDGPRFGGLIVRLAMLFNPLRVFAPAAGLFLLAGLAWTWRTYALTRQVSPVGAMLFLSAVFTLLTGLLADQIAAIRMGLGRRPPELSGGR